MNVDRTIAKRGINTQNPGFPPSTSVATSKMQEKKTSDDEEKKSSLLMPRTTTNFPFSKAVMPNMIATTPKIYGNWSPRPRMSPIMRSLLDRYITKTA